MKTSKHTPGCRICVRDRQNKRQRNSLDWIGMIMATVVAQEYLIHLKPAPMPSFHGASYLREFIIRQITNITKHRYASHHEWHEACGTLFPCIHSDTIQQLQVPNWISKHKFSSRSSRKLFHGQHGHSHLELPHEGFGSRGSDDIILA
jgi:hypothetical protein